MTPRSKVLAEYIRVIFAELADLDKTEPTEVDVLVASITSHLRAWRPASLTVSETTSPFEKL